MKRSNRPKCHVPPAKGNNKGFTLIELMIVITIIGLLNAVAIPNFLRYREKAFESAIRAEAKMFWIAAHAYFIDTPLAENVENPPKYTQGADIEKEGAITVNQTSGRTGGAVIFRHNRTDKVGKLDGKDGFIYIGYSS